MDQITQQLKSGMSEAENDEDLPSAPQDPHHNSSRHQIDREVEFDFTFPYSCLSFSVIDLLGTLCFYIE